ncbi:DUF2851 family protein [Mesonia sp. MT50]|uniref:DUF2851 family protein n=1 Tax=Mesonia profundi TaxID=3070998 RepID=A0ABU0ZXB5_9FLAO|nr:DUF2851 family protein [Mesonia profundi]MDQ7916114.1 DUF2851 family protein [Mesonia profundi]
MKEDFLHYLWKFKKFDFLNALTAQGETLQILQVGNHNETKSGPDFFNAKLRIGNQVWAGNVEIHINSSDWYAHHHEEDPAYDNVILHVVWKHDVEVFRENNTPIATLQLSDFASAEALKNYLELVEKANYNWINCEKDLASVSGFIVKNWLERLYIERLQEKTKVIQAALTSSRNDWEAVCFQLLAKNFGLNVNGKAFFVMASALPFSVVRKMRDQEELEALFFGMLQMFPKEFDDVYVLRLKESFEYQKKKYKLEPVEQQVAYFRLRPPNFPSIRLAQLAFIYATSQNIFLKLMQLKTRKEIHALFKVEVSDYWKNHFNFGKESKSSAKVLSPGFIDLLIINTIVPLKFHFASLKSNSATEECFSLLNELPKEKNATIEKFNELRPKMATSALESQALLHLKPNYCDQNKCLHCAIGLSLLKK